MARRLDKQKAIELRLRGFSYSQIKNEINVGKGTLNAWLKDYPLTAERLKEVRDWNAKRIERYRETRRKIREDRLSNIYKREQEKLFPLSDRDLFIAGLFLYWGEGSKTKLGEPSVSNTDPSVLNFFIHWLEKYMKFPRSKIKISLHLYKDMDINKEINFWSRTLKISKSQFRKPYIKTTFVKNISYKNGFNHGTCNVRICNVRIGEQVLMSIKAMQNHFLNLTGV